MQVISTIIGGKVLVGPSAAPSDKKQVLGFSTDEKLADRVLDWINIGVELDVDYQWEGVHNFLQAPTFSDAETARANLGLSEAALKDVDENITGSWTFANEVAAKAINVDAGQAASGYGLRLADTAGFYYAGRTYAHHNNVAVFQFDGAGIAVPSSTGYNFTRSAGTVIDGSLRSLSAGTVGVYQGDGTTPGTLQVGAIKSSTGSPISFSGDYVNIAGVKVYGANVSIGYHSGEVMGGRIAVGGSVDDPRSYLTSIVSGVVSISSNTTGTTLGTLRSAKIDGDSGGVQFASGYSSRWQLRDVGYWEPLVDNVYDFGGASKRVRNVYAATFSNGTTDRTIVGNETGGVLTQGFIDLNATGAIGQNNWWRLQPENAISGNLAFKNLNSSAQPLTLYSNGNVTLGGSGSEVSVPGILSVGSYGGLSSDASGAGRVHVLVNGSAVVSHLGTYTQFRSGMVLIGGGSSNSYLVGEEAHTLALRNGSNPQEYRIYEHYTNASNRSYLSIKANSGGNFVIEPKEDGSTLRGLTLGNATSGVSVPGKLSLATGYVNATNSAQVVIGNVFNSFMVGSAGVHLTTGNFIGWSSNIQGATPTAKSSGIVGDATHVTTLSDSGLKVRNLANTADTTITAGAATFSGTAESNKIYLNATNPRIDWFNGTLFFYRGGIARGSITDDGVYAPEGKALGFRNLGSSTLQSQFVGIADGAKLVGSDGTTLGTLQAGAATFSGDVYGGPSGSQVRLSGWGTDGKVNSMNRHLLLRAAGSNEGIEIHANTGNVNVTNTLAVDGVATFATTVNGPTFTNGTTDQTVVGNATGGVSMPGDLIISGTQKGIYLAKDGVNSALIYTNGSINKLHGYNGSPWIVESTSGFQVRNNTNSTDAPITAGAATFSSTLNVTGTNKITLGENTNHYIQAAHAAAALGLKIGDGSGEAVFFKTNEIYKSSAGYITGITLTPGAAGSIDLKVASDVKMTITESGDTTLNGHMKYMLLEMTSDPTTSEIDEGYRATVKNTTSGEIRDWVNDGGVMKKSAVYT